MDGKYTNQNRLRYLRVCYPVELYHSELLPAESPHSLAKSLHRGHSPEMSSTISLFGSPLSEVYSSSNQQCISV